MRDQLLIQSTARKYANQWRIIRKRDGKQVTSKPTIEAAIAWVDTHGASKL